MLFALKVGTLGGKIDFLHHIKAVQSVNWCPGRGSNPHGDKRQGILSPTP